ncbi:MAG: hypothetical protein LUD77_02650, partial [Clostridiales bacterium]|nr:hypothetical protein [Clostridiales bacterium]
MKRCMIILFCAVAVMYAAINYNIKKIGQYMLISAGEGHSMAVTEDGSLYTWGWNHSGALGNGTDKDEVEPLKIMDGVKAVSGGAEYSMAVTEDGSLYVWGCNEFGQLGNETTEDITTPLKIMDGVKAVSAGETHSMAIT